MFHDDKTIRVKINSNHPKDSKGGWMIYNFVEGLEGRGQSSPAAFYKKHKERENDKKSHETEDEIVLIKVDKPEVCVLEASARSVRKVIFEALNTSVNFAQVGQARMHDKIVAVTIQPKLTGYRPWAQIITGGEKRDPHTLFSFESKHEEDILFSITSMTDHAKNQLAMSIFVSQLVGDESLHVGQFMVKKEKGMITEITRIDFGARERFAIKRCYENDFDHQTSYAYQYSGQFGKDYISYLIAHPDIYARVMHFWKMIEVDKKFLDDYREEFKKEFYNLPESEFANALKGMEEIIYKGGMPPNKNHKIEKYARILSEILKIRIEEYKENAISNIESTLNETCKEVPDDITNSIKLIIFNNPITDQMKNDYDKIIKYLAENKPNVSIIILSHLQAEFQTRFFNQQTSKNDKVFYQDKIIELKNLKIIFQMLTELKNYYEEVKGYLNPYQNNIISRQIKILEEAISKNDIIHQDIDSLLTDNFKNTFSHPHTFVTLSFFRFGFFQFSDDRGVKLIDRFRKYSYDYKSHEKDIAELTMSTSPTTSSFSSPVEDRRMSKGY